jgi:hypothetical protein
VQLHALSTIISTCILVTHALGALYRHKTASIYRPVVQTKHLQFAKNSFECSEFSFKLEGWDRELYIIHSAIE